MKRCISAAFTLFFVTAILFGCANTAKITTENSDVHNRQAVVKEEAATVKVNPVSVGAATPLIQDTALTCNLASVSHTNSSPEYCLLKNADSEGVTGDVHYGINGKTYSVTFVDYDGTTIEKVSVQEGETALLPANPSQQGYVFAGWQGEYTNIQADIQIFAKYISVTSDNIFSVESASVAPGEIFTVSFNLGGTVKLCDFDLDLSYDGTLLEVISFDYEDGLADVVNHKLTNNLFTMNYSRAVNRTKEKEILNVTFKVKDAIPSVDTYIRLLTMRKVEYVDGSGNICAAPYYAVNGIIRIRSTGVITPTPTPGSTATPTPTPNSSATPTPTVYLGIRYGDANCDSSVNAADAAAVLRHVVKLIKLSDQGLVNAKVTLPVNGNNELSAGDAAAILRYTVHLITKFAVEE